MRARLFIASSFLGWTRLISYLWLDLTANHINAGCKYVRANIPRYAFFETSTCFQAHISQTISLLYCFVMSTTWKTWESASTNRWKSFNPLTKSWHELFLSALTYLASHNHKKTLCMHCCSARAVQRYHVRKCWNGPCSLPVVWDVATDSPVT